MTARAIRANGAIWIKEPVVLIPFSDYEELLVEAGYKKTPKLDREIAQARNRLKKGKYIPWDKIKGELK